MEKIAFAAKPAAASNKIKFYHLSCEKGELPLAGETEAYFIPFRTATVFPFSFPFGRKVNQMCIRDRSLARVFLTRRR